MKPVTLPPGRGKLATKPLPTGSETVAKMMGMVRVCCSSAAVVGVLCERMRSGCSATSSFANRCLDSASRRRPASVDPDVAALRPPELLESLPERRDVGLCFRVALGIAHQHADPPHPLALLRPRRKRPRDGRAAEKCDELAPLHVAPRLDSEPSTSRLGGELEMADLNVRFGS